MLYRTLKRVIECGQSGDIGRRLDIFFAAGKLSEKEYQELTGLLAARGA